MRKRGFAWAVVFERKNVLGTDRIPRGGIAVVECCFLGAPLLLQSPYQPQDEIRSGNLSLIFRYSATVICGKLVYVTLLVRVSFPPKIVDDEGDLSNAAICRSRPIKLLMDLSSEAS